MLKNAHIILRGVYIFPKNPTPLTEIIFEFGSATCVRNSFGHTEPTTHVLENKPHH